MLVSLISLSLTSCLLSHIAWKHHEHLPRQYITSCVMTTNGENSLRKGTLVDQKKGVVEGAPLIFNQPYGISAQMFTVFDPVSWSIRKGSVGASWHQRWGCSECEADALNVPCGDAHCDVSPERRIEILLPAFSCRRLRRKVMNAPSCYRHKCSHRLLQHLGQHLTQMSFDDGSSFFALISPFFSFPQSAKDLWTNRLKISSNHSLVWRGKIERNR